MHIHSSLVLATLWLTAALAAPAPSGPEAGPEIKGRSFKVDRVRRSDHKRNGPLALRRAFKKYGWSVPPSVAKAAAQAGGGQTGEVPAQGERNDAEYLSPVNIGGQTLMLNFDTGSSDLWVFSNQLPLASTQGHTAYNPSRSSSFSQLSGQTWSITYGDGSGARGVVGTDTVNVGGATVTRQAVELATAVSRSFVQDVNSDGLLGLAFSKINTVRPTQQKTFFDNIKADLALPVFTADLKRAETGSYEFGAIDTSKFTGELTYIPIDNSRGFWEFASSRFSVNGKMQSNPNPTTAIADTGTSLMLVDEPVAEAYYRQVRGAVNDPNIGGFVYPCSSVLPDFGVAIGNDYMAVIPGDGITFAQVDAQTCYGGIQSNAGQPLQIYGDVMFRAQFVVFDGGRNAVAFAPHN
ncbi:hypothetical protein MMC16_006643 [Acarospora aff. strigata]|nr:hypothetical protein [Acarospora aff. strigata]